jgi:hypothetical protein
MRNSLAYLIGIPLLVAGCNRTMSNPIIDASVDSPGSASIDTVTAATLAAVPLLKAEPYIEIGGNASKDTQFSSWIDVDYSAHGEIFVVDRLVHNVRVYDRNGKLLRVIGRRGGGPGELDYPDHVLLSNDTLLVMDRTSINRFSLDGRYITRAAYQMNFHDAKLGKVGIAPQTFDVTPKGLVTSANLHVMTPRTDEKPRPDTTSLFYMSGVDGAIEKPFMQVVSSEFYSFANGVGHRVALFAPESYFAVTSDGRVLVDARDGVSVDEYRNGAKTKRLLLMPSRRATTAADVDSLIERQRRLTEDMLKGPDLKAPKGFLKDVVTSLRKLPRQRFFPVADKLIPSNDGSVLMLRPDLSKGGFEWRKVYGTTVWDVISRDLTIIGRVEFPENFTPMIMRGDVVIGKHIDEDDVPSIIGYKLKRPPE